jgi:DNA-binding MarR family transcriptional regulator
MDEARKLAELTPKIMNAFHDLGRQHPEGEKLSMRQFQELIILHASGKLTLTQFCEKLSLAPSTGTELVNRMIELGFIDKGTEKKDQRLATLSVSQKGIELLKQRREALTEMFTKFFSPFDAADRLQFVACFEKVWDLIEKYQSRKMNEKGK